MAGPLLGVLGVMQQLVQLYPRPDLDQPSLEWKGRGFLVATMPNFWELRTRNVRWLAHKTTRDGNPVWVVRFDHLRSGFHVESEKESFEEGRRDVENQLREILPAPEVEA